MGGPQFDPLNAVCVVGEGCPLPCFSRSCWGWVEEVMRDKIMSWGDYRCNSWPFIREDAWCTDRLAAKACKCLSPSCPAHGLAMSVCCSVHEQCTVSLKKPSSTSSSLFCIAFHGYCFCDSMGLTPTALRYCLLLFPTRIYRSLIPDQYLFIVAFTQPLVRVDYLC